MKTTFSQSKPFFSPTTVDERSGDVQDPHERPDTMMTPEPKRNKTSGNDNNVMVPLVLSYPSTVQVPSKRTIMSFYQAALGGVEPPSSPSNIQDDSSDYRYKDQNYLKAAGVLSLEQVLLPALGLEEEKAIKRIQATVQRDAPEYKFVMENCRRMVRQAVSNAIVAVSANREKRVRQQVERRRIHALELKECREARKREIMEALKKRVQEQKRQREIVRVEQKSRIKQNLARNQKLWKEVVFLTSSLSHLEREERLWIQAEMDLKQLEEKREHEKISTGNESTDDKENASPMILAAKNHSLHSEVECKAMDIAMASDRIQKGLVMVLQLLKESEEVRCYLYEKYRKDYLFQGYQSIDDPRGIIRFLSQNSEVDFQ
jgi:hypothetical protein